mmetsp:Transcript_117698/g.375111  ORF Transcript_117698/g.375111 Transcript_117698/m.375111 type:complete len:578 (+) Transcript_117698:50-1783(+)
MVRCCGVKGLEYKRLLPWSQPLDSEAIGEADPRRITISDSTGSGEPKGPKVFKLEGQEIVLFGGNYVMKARPYFPPLDVVVADAQRLAQELKLSAYRPPPAKDGSPRRAVCCVRLGAMMEGAMPDEAMKLDEQWAANLEAAIKAFADAGVYVFLDVHQDAYCTTNGGDGLPWWMAAEMQRTAGCCTPSGECHCCCCCCGSPNPSYLTSPEHPLKLMLPWCIAKCIGMRQIETDPEDQDPWRNFSVGGQAGHPGLMNIGNINMRLNNHDVAWAEGTVGATRQCHNFATRFHESPFSERDREPLFEPYLQHIRYLCRAWERHWNVVAVELLNEPFLAGLPNVLQMMVSRRRLFDFHLATLEGLERSEPPVRAPIALQDGHGSIEGASLSTKLLAVVPVSAAAQQKLTEWGRNDRLILSFHYYPGPVTTMDFGPFIAKARRQADELMGGAPLFLSEFWAETSQEEADMMAEAANLGCTAITYWQYVNEEFTGNPGWYKYPPEVELLGDPISFDGVVNWEAWMAYQKTVRDGTAWGGMICGAAGAQEDVIGSKCDAKQVLARIPRVPPLRAPRYASCCCCL